MSDKITSGMLDKRAEYLNKLTNSPLSPYAQVDGLPTGQIGNYHISESAGSYGLCRIANKAGGATEIAWGKTKKELLGKIEAYERGLRNQMEVVAKFREALEHIANSENDGSEMGEDWKKAHTKFACYARSILGKGE